MSPGSSVGPSKVSAAFGRLAVLVAVAVAVAQLSDFVWALRRYTVGLGATVNPLAHPLGGWWDPPLPPLILIVTAVLAAAFYGWWIVRLAQAEPVPSQLPSSPPQAELHPSGA
jgi:hypothetical protein